MLKSNPDSAQLPVRQRALEDGKTVYMAVPRLAGPEPFFALDPDHLSEPPRKAASISGAARSARRVTLAELSPAGRAAATVAVQDGLADPDAYAQARVVLTARGRLLADAVIRGLTD